MLVRTTWLTSALVFGGFTVLLALLPVPDASINDPETDTAGNANREAETGGRGATPATTSAPPLVIDNVRYFDGQTAHPPTTLLLSAGRISAIGPAAETADAATRIDGTGLTLLPGLIDAHVHTFGNARKQALDFGVTTVIDMFTDPSNLVGARQARERWSVADGAALYSAGMLATVDGGHGTQFQVEVDTLAGADEAPEWVAARLTEGSDFIKLVYMPEWDGTPSLDLATATAVIDAAHEAGVMAVAHIASQAGARELLHAGIDGFVHVFADEQVDDAFVRTARERGIFVIPTLSIIATASGRSTGPTLLEDDAFSSRLDPLSRANLQRDYGQVIPAFDLDVALDNVRRLHEAGVPILAGSDAPNPGTAHGATLHAELALLVRAGLSPTQALAAATSVPARVFHLEGRGVIAPGARADLLLVDGRPGQRIEATRAIVAILRNGYRLGASVSDLPPHDAPSPDAAAASIALPEVLGTFDTDLEGPAGLIWAPTSDEMMGGTSKAEVTQLAREDGGALGVKAVVASGFNYPWAGAWFGVQSPDQPLDITDARAIRFEVRGTAASYRLMLFEQDSFGAPPTVQFEVGEQWRSVEIPLSQFFGFVPALFTGMAFVTPMTAGEYEFALDDVRLIR